MDPLRSYLGRLLLEEITPVVMVLTTPLAEAACRKSGLSVVDMLSPFSLFKKIDGDSPPRCSPLPIIVCVTLVAFHSIGFCNLMGNPLYAVPVRTASDQPYRLQMFKIRMVYASDVRKQDYEVILELSGSFWVVLWACSVWMPMVYESLDGHWLFWSRWRIRGSSQ